MAGKLTISIERVRRLTVRRIYPARQTDEEQQRTRAPADDIPRLPPLPDKKEKKS